MFMHYYMITIDSTKHPRYPAKFSGMSMPPVQQPRRGEELWDDRRFVSEVRRNAALQASIDLDSTLFKFQEPGQRVSFSPKACMAQVGGNPGTVDITPTFYGTIVEIERQETDVDPYAAPSAPTLAGASVQKQWRFRVRGERFSSPAGEVVQSEQQSPRGLLDSTVFVAVAANLGDAERDGGLAGVHAARELLENSYTEKWATAAIANEYLLSPDVLIVPQRCLEVASPADEHPVFGGCSLQPARGAFASASGSGSSSCPGGAAAKAAAAASAAARLDQVHARKENGVEIPHPRDPGQTLKIRFR